MKEKYQTIHFRGDSYGLIATMEGIIEEYVKLGYKLTTRQLYYQLVARDVIPNSERSYKNIASLIDSAKRAGLLDWDAIEDRTREFLRRQRWASGQDIMEAAANSYHMDMWENQKNRVFVIVEKEALVSILDKVCRVHDVPVLAARGYPSGTVLREFATEDMIPAMGAGQGCVVLHFGDHDPSGLDMTRDLSERLTLFSRVPVQVERLALNMGQIKKYKPPPNPAKVTDARFKGYQKLYGKQSWELDSMKPDVLATLVEKGIEKYVDDDAWEDREHEIEGTRAKLHKIAKRFKRIR